MTYAVMLPKAFGMTAWRLLGVCLSTQVQLIVPPELPPWKTATAAPAHPVEEPGNPPEACSSSGPSQMVNWRAQSLCCVQSHSHLQPQAWQWPPRPQAHPGCLRISRESRCASGARAACGNLAQIMHMCCSGQGSWCNSSGRWTSHCATLDTSQAPRNDLDPPVLPCTQAESLTETPQVAPRHSKKTQIFHFKICFTVSILGLCTEI